MVATKLLHFLCATTRSCARVLPAQIRPEILTEVLQCLIKEEFSESRESRMTPGLDEKPLAQNGLQADKAGSCVASAGRKMH